MACPGRFELHSLKNSSGTNFRVGVAESPSGVNTGMYGTISPGAPNAKPPKGGFFYAGIKTRPGLKPDRD